MLMHVITGARARFTATLYDRAAALQVVTGTVKAVLHVDGVSICDEATCLAGDAGADWPNGIVAIEFSKTVTAAIVVTDPFNAEIEVRMDDDRWTGGTILVQKGATV